MQLAFLFLMVVGTAVAIEPFSVAAVAFGVGGALYAALDSSVCRVLECCDDRSIKKDFEALKSNLTTQVYGQPLVVDVVVRALKGHFYTLSPSKALVLSFHGTQGCGKNYVSNFIRDAIFVKGVSSSYYTLFTGAFHFPNPSETGKYQAELRGFIKRKVKECARSVFVFDDVHRIPPGVLDALKPFIDHHESLDGIDYRKSTFIFLSNTGAALIAKRALEIWHSGRPREDIKLSDFESMIRSGAFNEEGNLHKSDADPSDVVGPYIPFLPLEEKLAVLFIHELKIWHMWWNNFVREVVLCLSGGLFKSENVASNLIDHYIPFLPLEQKHVEKCIDDEFRKWKFTHTPQSAKEAILEDITFGPGNEKIFSASGCKRISAKVAAYVQGQRLELFSSS